MSKEEKCCFGENLSFFRALYYIKQYKEKGYFCWFVPVIFTCGS